MRNPMTYASAAAVALAGCASVPPPTEQVAAARAMVIQAEPVAVQHAPLELQRAQLKLARAEQAMGSRDYPEARRLAEQAEADARLAWTAAESQRMQRAALEVERGVKVLKEELDRRKP